MILQALRELAIAENLVGDPDFEYRPVSWIVELTEAGRFVQIADHRLDQNEGKTDKNGKPVKARLKGRNEEVPTQPGRTSGDLAFAFVDKAEYALGLDPTGKRPTSKLEARASLFRNIVHECAEATDDPVVRTVDGFLSTRPASRPEVMEKIPDDLAANDMIAFRVGEETCLVHQRPSARGWWKAKSAIVAASGDARYRCLVSGEPIAEPGLVPLIKPVPGGTPSGVALVSFNANVFESYGLDANENAPIGPLAAQEISTAMNRLLSRSPIDADGKALPVRRIGLSSDTIAVYWSPEGDQNTLDALLSLAEVEATERVGELYRSVWRGEMPSLRDPSRFYAAVLTGTQGRAVVRGYLETTVEQAVAALAQHFADLRISPNAPAPKGQQPSPAIPLRSILDALAAPGRESSVPAALAADIMTAALEPGRSYPLSALQRALLRERAEAGADGWVAASRRDARAALIKGVLIRHFNIPVEVTMNPATDSDGYQLGMLTAVLERLQAIAIDNANATLVDRFFAAASATPGSVFPRLLKLARHHARKASGSDKRMDQVLARRYERLIDATLSRFGVGDLLPSSDASGDRAGQADPLRRYPSAQGAFPSHLPLPEQGQFVLGYHQMRHWLWMNDAERVAWEQQHPDVDRAYLWKNAKAAEADTEPATV